MLTAILVLLAAAGWIAVVALYLGQGNLRERMIQLERRNGELTEQDGRIKGELSAAKKELGEERERGNEARSDLKKAKEKIHQQSQETKKEVPGGKAAKGAKSTTTAGSDHEALVVARHDLSAAKSEVESLKQRIDGLNADVKKAQARESELMAWKPEPTVAAPAAAPEIDREQIEAKVRADLDKEIKGLRSDRSDTERKRQELFNEVGELKKRLSKTLRETDKQRNRADNNEKAYEITKSQLERALDRLHEFDPSVPRPFRAPAPPPGEGKRRRSRGGDGATAEESFETSADSGAEADAPMGDEAPVAVSQPVAPVAETPMVATPAVPVEAPAAPVAEPVAAPVAEPVAAPVAEPVAAPVAASTPAPSEAPAGSPKEAAPAKGGEKARRRPPKAKAEAGAPPAEGGESDKPAQD